VTEAYGIDPLLTAISNLPRTDRWSVLARQALRADLYSVTAALTQSVLSMDQGSAALTMASWEGHYATSTSRARSTLMEIVAVEHPDIATISVALRVLRTLIAQTSTS
jgi:glutamate dehydrogenase